MTPTYNEVHIEALQARLQMKQSEQDSLFDAVIKFVESHPIRWPNETDLHFIVRCEAWFINLNSILEGFDV